MIDIHHHLLWGMDDGASSMETSVAMAKMAAADGIRISSVLRMRTARTSMNLR